LAKKIGGSVYWIQNGKQTSKVVEATEAFSDSAQASAQVIYAEASGDRAAVRLARLAFRQFQGRRFRAQRTGKRRARRIAGKQRNQRQK
jgi:hypothetical protein